MSHGSQELGHLFDDQVRRLHELHFLILFWAAQGEGRSCKYNITNCFDDLKHAGLTRTKQTAVAAIEGLATLCFIDIRDERNRKNIYITRYGAKALEVLVMSEQFQVKPSVFLEEQ
jgi:hypothetical protein